MTKKQNVKRRSKIEKQYDEMRAKLWPHITDGDIWEPDIGYTPIPRSFPYILNLMDSNSSGGPVSKVYLALWSRAFSQMMVRVKSPDELAAESGFTGQRKIQTWRSKMKKLVEWGFLETKSGTTASEYTYCLIKNPHSVIKKLVEDEVWTTNDEYNAYIMRLIETE